MPSDTWFPERPRPTPFFRGDGDVSHLCGRGRALLTEGVLDGHLVNLVLKCPLCLADNEM